VYMGTGQVAPEGGWRKGGAAGARRNSFETSWLPDARGRPGALSSDGGGARALFVFRKCGSLAAV